MTKLSDVKGAMNNSTIIEFDIIANDSSNEITWDSYAYPCGLMARSFFNGFIRMTIFQLFYKIRISLRTRIPILMKQILLGKQTKQINSEHMTSIQTSTNNHGSMSQTVPIYHIPS